MIVPTGSANWQRMKNVPPLFVPISKTFFGFRSLTTLANSKISLRTCSGVVRGCLQPRLTTSSGVRLVLSDLQLAQNAASASVERALRGRVFIHNSSTASVYPISVNGGGQRTRRSRSGDGPLIGSSCPRTRGWSGNSKLITIQRADSYRRKVCSKGHGCGTRLR